MVELWDAYDIEFNKIPDVTLERGQRLPDGIFHLVCEIIVRHEDGQYLLMQRAPEKPHGGMWELTACGSAFRGETPLECATRELKEETGIEAASMEELGRITHAARHTIYVEYLCVTECEKNRIQLQKNETVAYRWIDLNDLHLVENLRIKRMQLFLEDL